MVLELTQVSKAYGKGTKRALEGFTARLTPGVYAILGPNGAGKSTLMNLITDNLERDEGSITYDGRDIGELGPAFRQVLGYMPQQQGLYEDFTAAGFLWYMAALKGLPRKETRRRVPELLKLVNLEEAANRKLGSFSGGMKQRVLIAQALLNDPEVLILDEPTAGLDPKERIRIRNFISEIAFDKIVLFATHVVSDIEFIAKEILLMKEGHLLFQGPQEELLRTLAGKVYEAEVPRDRVEWMRQRYSVGGIVAGAQGAKVRFLSETPPDLIGCAAAEPDLEDVYLYYFSDGES